MIMRLKEYTSAEEIAETLDEQINETKNILGEHLRKLEDVQTVAEKSKKAREAILKLAGKKAPVENSSEITVGSLSVVLDATPLNELAVLEAAVSSQQEKLLTLQKVRDGLKWLDELSDAEGLKFIVIEKEDIPERILLKTT